MTHDRVFLHRSDLFSSVSYRPHSAARAEAVRVCIQVLCTTVIVVIPVLVVAICCQLPFANVGLDITLLLIRNKQYKR